MIPVPMRLSALSALATNNLSVVRCRRADASFTGSEPCIAPLITYQALTAMHTFLPLGLPPTLSRNPRKAPWLEQRQSADQLRKRAWMLRGGVFVLLLRKIRKYRALAPSMYLVYLRRGFKVFKVHR